MTPLFQLKAITKNYPTATALDGVSLAFPATGMVFIKGKSGCGKTTLLNVLDGLDDVTAGTILYEGQEISKYNAKQWDDYRNRQVGIVFQDYNLIDGLTVGQNIELSLDIQDELVNEAERLTRVKDVLAFVGLDKFAHRQVTELSGGQKQRVAIARAIAKNCKVILADEPTGNLDSDSGTAILTLLKEIAKTRLVLIVTHDVPSALSFGDRIITISDGKIIDDMDISDAAKNTLVSVQVVDTAQNVVLHMNEKAIEEAKKILADWLLEQSDAAMHYEIDIKKVNRQHVAEEKQTPEVKTRPISAQSLAWKKKLSLARANLAQKKIRLLLTALMFSLTIFLLLIVSFILAYDRTQTISKYLEEQNIFEAYLFQQHSYTNKVFDTKTNNISKGDYYVHELAQLLPNATLLPRLKVESIVFENAEIFAGMATTDEVTLVLSSTPETYGKELLDGRYPQNGNEIAITDYAAFSQLKYKKIIGQTVVADGIPCKVVGILKTDYEEKQIPLKLKMNDLNEFEQFDVQNVYSLAITTDDYRARLKSASRTLTMPSSDFLISDMETRYLESSVEYAPLALLNSKAKTKVVAGRLPSAPNEVLISSAFAERHMLREEDFKKPIQYEFLNIYRETYSNTFADVLNLADFFTDGIVVTGIYAGEAIDEEYSPDVMLHDAQYQKVLDAYTDDYCFQDYALCVSGMDTTSLVKTADSNGFWFNEPAISKIYQFQGILENLLSIIIIIFITIVLITVFMLSTYISNNIKVNTKKVGVLKAIGVPTWDVASIFLLEAVMISVISFATASGLTSFFITFVNSHLINQIPNHAFDYLYWNWKMTVPIFLLSIGLSITAAVFPLLKLAAKKPVDVIRNSE
jgi:ABC-type lipoprotein export system ATPase subunit/ABC-type antimicrobial peptide transport system permease subunit